jgi:hypothetical protein
MDGRTARRKPTDITQMEEECRFKEEGFQCPAEAKLVAGDQKIKTIQYINTIILTGIGIFAIMIFAMLSDVKTGQTDTRTTEAVLSTNQKVVMQDVSDLKTRVLALERDRTAQIQAWVEENFIRRDQK